jgi:hypothetical protein
VLSKSTWVWIALLLVACGDRRAKPDAAPVQVATIEEKPVTLEEIEELAGRVERDCKTAPRWKDPRLGRVTDPRNFAWIVDASVPVADRMERVGAWFGGPNRLMKAYARCSMLMEVAVLTAYTLELGAELGELFDAFLETFPPDDPGRKSREEGRRQVTAGQAQMIRSAPLVLRELAAGDRAGATELATRIGAATARLRRDGALIEQAIDGVRKLVENEKDAARRAVLQAMLDAATAPAP